MGRRPVSSPGAGESALPADISFCAGRGWLACQGPGAGLRLPAPGCPTRKAKEPSGMAYKKDVALAFPSVDGTFVHELDLPQGLTNWGLCCEGLRQPEKGAS